VVISAQVFVPDQVKVLKGYKKRLQKMIAAQKDANGNFKSNPEAEVAHASSPRGGAFGSVIRGNPWSWRSRPPNPRWEGLASWGAYHAARVATQAIATATRKTADDRNTSD